MGGRGIGCGGWVTLTDGLALGAWYAKYSREAPRPAWLIDASHVPCQACPAARQQRLVCCQTMPGTHHVGREHSSVLVCEADRDQTQHNLIQGGVGRGTNLGPGRAEGAGRLGVAWVGDGVMEAGRAPWPRGGSSWATGAAKLSSPSSTQRACSGGSLTSTRALGPSLRPMRRGMERRSRPKASVESASSGGTTSSLRRTGRGGQSCCSARSYCRHGSQPGLQARLGRHSDVLPQRGPLPLQPGPGHSGPELPVLAAGGQHRAVLTCICILFLIPYTGLTAGRAPPAGRGWPPARPPACAPPTAFGT